MTDLHPSKSSTDAVWLIVVCVHGYRVEWRGPYEAWQHMDAPDAVFCDSDAKPRVVQVVESLRQAAGS